jgi:hypothetical protein
MNCIRQSLFHKISWARPTAQSADGLTVSTRYRNRPYRDTVLFLAWDKMHGSVTMEKSNGNRITQNGFEVFLHSSGLCDISHFESEKAQDGSRLTLMFNITANRHQLCFQNNQHVTSELRGWSVWNHPGSRLRPGTLVRFPRSGPVIWCRRVGKWTTSPARIANTRSGYVLLHKERRVLKLVGSHCCCVCVSLPHSWKPA